MDFTFPIGRARYQCMHETHGSCVLITNNDPESNGVSVRVFPQNMSVGWWYAPATKGFDSEAALQWLSENSVMDVNPVHGDPMLATLPGVFTTQEWTQLIILNDVKPSPEGLNYCYEITLRHPATDQTFTRKFTISTQWWMTLLTELYPGSKIHRSEVEYLQWKKDKAMSAVEKRRKTLAEAKALRP